MLSLGLELFEFEIAVYTKQNYTYNQETPNS